MTGEGAYLAFSGWNVPFVTHSDMMYGLSIVTSQIIPSCTPEISDLTVSVGVVSEVGGARIHKEKKMQAAQFSFCFP